MNDAVSHDPFPTFSAALASALDGLLAPGATAYLDMVADDVVMEFPYAPEDGTRQVAGRAALTAYLGQVAALVGIERIDVEAVHRSAEPGVVVIEFTGEGRGRRGGTPYHQRYISVVHVRDGRISRYRDYWNPSVVQAVAAAEARVGAGGRA